MRRRWSKKLWKTFYLILINKGKYRILDRQMSSTYGVLLLSKQRAYRKAQCSYGDDEHPAWRDARRLRKVHEVFNYDV